MRSNNFVMSKWKWCQTAFNFLDRDHAAPAEDHWPGAAAEIAAHVRIPVTDGINILLIKRKKKQNFY